MPARQNPQQQQKNNNFLQYDFRATVLSQAERCPEQRWVKADFFLVLQYDNSESQ